MLLLMVFVVMKQIPKCLRLPTYILFVSCSLSDGFFFYFVNFYYKM